MKCCDAKETLNKMKIREYKTTEQDRQTRVLRALKLNCGLWCGIENWNVGQILARKLGGSHSTLIDEDSFQKT